MNSFAELLKSFDTCIKNYNPRAYKTLPPPLSSSQIDKYFKQIGIDNNDLKLLYQWKDGIDYTFTDDGYEMFDWGALQGLAYISTIDTTLWTSNFVLVIADLEGGCLLFNNEPGQNYGKLHLYSVPLLHIEKPISYYDSIYSMIQTTIEAYEKGILTYDPETDSLNKNIDEFRKVATKYNKGSDYWKKE